MHTRLMNTYKRQPISFTKGEGVWLWDKNSKKYLDALCGYGVCGLGHCHPKIAAAITQQAQTLLHTSNLYHIDAQETLAHALTTQANMDKAFFCSSGTEANEAAIKLARLHAHKKNYKDPIIVVAQNAFHGRTMGALAATDGEKIKQGFGQLISGFLRVPFNDIQTIQQLTNQGHEIAAVMIEPIQGVGGVRAADLQFLQQLRELCDKENWLLIMDEVQTGIGRTGQLFAYQDYGILPDIVTAAKCLGNGIPIGACLARASAADLYTPESHGTTFGGNPFACQIALTVLDVIEQDQLLPHVRNISKFIFEKLRILMSNNPNVIDIRGKGLMIGIELAKPCNHLVEAAMHKGLLLSVVSQSVIRLLPPLIINYQQAETMLSLLNQVIDTIQD